MNNPWYDRNKNKNKRKKNTYLQGSISMIKIQENPITPSYDRDVEIGARKTRKEVCFETMEIRNQYNTNKPADSDEYKKSQEIKDEIFKKLENLDKEKSLPSNNNKQDDFDMYSNGIVRLSREEEVNEVSGFENDKKESAIKDFDMNSFQGTFFLNSNPPEMQEESYLKTSKPEKNDVEFKELDLNHLEERADIETKIQADKNIKPENRIQEEENTQNSMEEVKPLDLKEALKGLADKDAEQKFDLSFLLNEIESKKSKKMPIIEPTYESLDFLREKILPKNTDLQTNHNFEQEETKIDIQDENQQINEIDIIEQLNNLNFIEEPEIINQENFEEEAQLSSTEKSDFIGHLQNIISIKPESDEKHEEVVYKTEVFSKEIEDVFNGSYYKTEEDFDNFDDADENNLNFIESYCKSHGYRLKKDNLDIISFVSEENEEQFKKLSIPNYNAFYINSAISKTLFSDSEKLITDFETEQAKILLEEICLTSVNTNIVNKAFEKLMSILKEENNFKHINNILQKMCRKEEQLLNLIFSC